MTAPGFLDDAQCAALREWASARAFETSAPITTTRGFVDAPDVRNNARLIVDDVDWAAHLWTRVRTLFATLIEGVPAVGVNERFRFYRYTPGQYFRVHRDGAFRRPGTDEQSLYTLMIYLSDVEEGGTTRFHEFGLEVTPEPGLLCAFHHPLLQAGEEVMRGEKWVLRTDVMFDLTPT